MPITWRVGDGHRADVLFSGAYSAEESERVMKEIFAEPRLPRPLRLLVDVRHTVPPDAEFVVNAVTFWQLHVRDMWGARVAVVAATDSQLVMASVSEQAIEGRELPFTLRAFHESDWDRAERWLAEGHHTT
jgi:hypothetical protein